MSKEETRTLRLTSRDLDTLSDLGDYRFMSIAQLAALHFPTEGAAQARLRRLVEGGLALKVYVPVRPYDRSAHTIYALSAKGARELADARGCKRPRHLSERERRSGLFLDHTLRRNDLRVCLELLQSMEPGFRLLIWRQAKDEVGTSARVRVGRGREQRVPIVPDGYFAVQIGAGFENFVVEIDMGTVRLDRMALRYKAYWKWWKAGGHKALYGPLPIRVLTLTTTPRRLEALRKAAMEAPMGGSTGSNLFWFACLECADIQSPEKLLTPVWTTAQKRPGPLRKLIKS